MTTSVESVSSSDWMLLSGVLCPNYSSLLDNKKSPNVDTKGSLYGLESFGKRDSKKDLWFEDVSEVEFWAEAAEPIQISILDEHHIQSVWSADYSSLSQQDSPSDFASKFKQSWNDVQANPLDDILTSQSLTNYTAAFLPVCMPEAVFKKPKVHTSEAGIQTMTTSIQTLPVVCCTHPVPWGLDTDEPSPLTTHNLTVDHGKKSSKRKLEDHAWSPKKKPSLALDDQEFLDEMFSFLKSPIVLFDYSDNHAAINEEGVIPYSTTCEYEGLVEVERSSYGSRSVATNTMHVPLRQGSSRPTRYRAWCHAAKQYLSVEDQVDKRGPRIGSREERTKRMENEILAYYCR